MTADPSYHCALCGTTFVVPALARACEAAHLSEPADPEETK